MLTPNTLLQDRYLIVEQLEQNGSHTIYLAEDQQKGCRVALEEITASDGLGEEIEQKARALMQLKHPSLAEVTDYFSHADNHYIVTEQAAGDDPAKLMEDRGGPFSPGEVARLGASLLDALDYLHTQEPPIIHGQVRPENLKIEDGKIVLLNPDQSLQAKDTGDQSAYNSPEQSAGGAIDARSDLYSAGATLSYLLTGEVPPDAETRLEMVGSNEEDPLGRTDEIKEEGASEMSDAIGKAMSLDREDRYASAAEMRDALDEASNSGEELAQTAATQVMPKAALAGKQKTNPAPWLIGAVAVVIVAAIAITLMIIKPGSGDATSGGLLGGGGSLKNVKISPREMEIIFQEMIPPQDQMAISKSPEQKKKLVKQVKEFLAITQQAESEGYGDKIKPELQAEISLTKDRVLAEAFKKKNPTATASEADINAYYQAHPTAFDDFVNSSPELQSQLQMQAQGPQGEMMKQRIKKQYGEIKVFADRGRGANLDQDDVVKIKTLFSRSSVLNNAYLEDLEKKISDQIKPEDADTYYNEHQGEFDALQVRHILIGTDDGEGTREEKRQKAEQALARVRGGEDFAKVASEVSDDPGSKAKGGDLGTVSKGDLVPEFEKAMFALQPGQISDVVETPFGFHIIKVESRTPKPSPLGDEAGRQRVIDMMKRERIEKRIEEIAASSGIEVPEDFNATPKPLEMPPGAMPPGHPPTPAQGQPQ